MFLLLLLPILVSHLHFVRGTETKCARMKAYISFIVFRDGIGADANICPGPYLRFNMNNSLMFLFPLGGVGKNCANSWQFSLLLDARVVILMNVIPLFCPLILTLIFLI